MSNTTKTEYLGEDVPTDATALPALPEPEQDQLPVLDPKHDHTHDDGELEPMCSGGGCVQKTSV
ncbi:hypothetical protein [Saccharothrix sp. NRRL B-16314]|uniref:hypothetical protein n=1 Tax=Saccharothrix sp. NRRL B-16314 TaxID=1463825 RepID=UPI000526A5DA|nr:hypothetical protein [Saccharothrix sp. NRRL B-16314]